MKIYLLPLTFFLLLAIAGCEQSAPSSAVSPKAAAITVKPDTRAVKPAVATALRPALRVATLDGGTYDLSEYRGKWVIVNFWATWCTPCLKEMPELSALHAMREQVKVVGLAYEEIDSNAMKSFLRKHPVVYPIAILDVYAPPADFAAPRGLPVTYLIAPDGKVSQQFLGPVTAKEIESAIAVATKAAT